MIATLFISFFVVIGTASVAVAKDGKRNHARATSMFVPQGFALKKRARPYIPIKARQSAMCCAKFSIKANGRPSNIDMRCTDRLFKDIASKALRRWEYRPVNSETVMAKMDGAAASFSYGIYNPGNKRKIRDNKSLLIIDGEYNMDPSRVCPTIFGEQTQ